MWRLSCGCLRDYPGMPIGRVHHVLCVACRIGVTTLYAYDERRCGHTSSTSRAEDGKLMHVSCTSPEGNEDCKRGVHYDRYVQMRFEEQGRLRASQDGQTGRA
jgi:hypothetical protein